MTSQELMDNQLETNSALKHHDTAKPRLTLYHYGAQYTLVSDTTTTEAMLVYLNENFQTSLTLDDPSVTSASRSDCIAPSSLTKRRNCLVPPPTPK